MEKDKKEIEATKLWVNKFVIGHGLCPFAKVPFDQERIRYSVSDAESMETHLETFWNEIVLLKNTPPSQISNSLLIFPDGFSAFSNYLDFYYLCEDLLLEEKENHNFQLASFHPKYQFAGTAEGDVTNYTNRSPYPMIHILRIVEVEAAISAHPDIDSVPENNMEKMREFREGALKNMLSDLTPPKDEEF